MTRRPTAGVPAGQNLQGTGSNVLLVSFDEGLVIENNAPSSFAMGSGLTIADRVRLQSNEVRSQQRRTLMDMQRLRMDERQLTLQLKQELKRGILAEALANQAAKRIYGMQQRQVWLGEAVIEFDVMLAMLSTIHTEAQLQDATVKIGTFCRALNAEVSSGDMKKLSDRFKADRAVIEGKQTERRGLLGDAQADSNAIAVGEAATVRPVAVYEAFETGSAPPETFDAVLVHSPRAGRALAASLAPEQASRRIAVAISPAAAAALAKLRFAEVRVAPAPNEAAMTAALGKPGGRV